MSEEKSSVIRALKNKCSIVQKENFFLREQLKAKNSEVKKYKRMFKNDKYADSAPEYLKDWTTGHVCQQLLALGLGTYTKIFTEKNIDGALLDGGYIDKADLVDLGMKGFDAAKLLTWVSDCLDAGGAVRLVGRALDGTEISEAVKYAIFSDDQKTDFVVSKKNIVKAIMKHSRFQTLARQCEELEPLCKAKKLWKKFNEIDCDGTGFITLKEIVSRIGPLRPQPVFSKGFAEIFANILSQISKTETISKSQLLKALTFNSYNITRIAHKYGHSGYNPLLLPSKFHKAFDNLVSTTAEKRKCVSFRALTIYFMRNHEKYKSENDAVSNFGNAGSVKIHEPQQTFRERNLVGAKCYSRLVSVLQQRQQEIALKKGGSHGFHCLSKQVSAMRRKINSLQSTLRTVHNLQMNEQKNRTLAAQLKTENAEIILELQRVKRELEEKKDLEMFEAKQLSDMRKKASYDMMVPAKTIKTITKNPVLKHQRVPNHSLTKKSPPLTHLPTRPAGKPGSYHENSQRQKKIRNKQLLAGKHGGKYSGYKSRRVGNVPRQLQSYNPEYLLEQKVEQTEKMMKSSSPERKAFGRGISSEKIKRNGTNKRELWERVPSSDWSKFK